MAKRLLVVFIILVSVLSIESIAQSKQWTLYGYGQVDFLASTKSGTKSGFDQRRVNLIGEFFPDEKMRVLTDIEYEGGATLNVGDSSYSGTIKISRAWLEYTVFPELKFRAGKMLTPFGLYNLVHDASASYFPLEPPIMYSELLLDPKLRAQRLYSKYQIGVEVLGTINLNEDGSQLDYSIGLGNGRGAMNDGTDINNNRSVSSRMVYRPSSVAGLQIGSSIYFDRNYSGLGGIKNDLEYSGGVDLQYENSFLQFQMEGMLTNYKITSSSRMSTGAGYAQIVYTVFDELSPYINYSIVLFDLKNSENKLARTNLGINWAVSQNLFLKSEIQFHEAEETVSDESFKVFVISAAFTF
ncbi:MAG: hypothetical protein C0412_19800 [Flavobacterium sp.]|nr:hypothetical protein [Flavobacterium sp.]